MYAIVFSLGGEREIAKEWKMLQHRFLILVLSWGLRESRN